MDIREGLCQRSNPRHDSENEYKYRWENKKTDFNFCWVTSEMEDFLRVNPGLSRRIPNFLQSKDYTPMELVEITKKILHTYKKVKGLDFDCSVQDIDRFKKPDVELGIACFSRDKSSVDQTFSGQAAMTTTLNYAMHGLRQQRLL